MDIIGDGEAVGERREFGPHSCTQAAPERYKHDAADRNEPMTRRLAGDLRQQQRPLQQQKQPPPMNGEPSLSSPFSVSHGMLHLIA